MDVKDSDGCMGSLYNTSVVGKCCLTVGASLSLFFFFNYTGIRLSPYSCFDAIPLAHTRGR